MMQVVASAICHLYNVASILMTVPSIKLMINFINDYVSKL